MSAIEHLIERMIMIYGEPKCADPMAYVDEIRGALKGFSDAALKAAGDMARNECKWFPKPAELRELALRAAASLHKPTADEHATDALPQRTPEQIARANELMERFRNAMSGKFVDEHTPQRIVDASRDAMDAMQRQSPNQWLHRRAPGLTARSRAMSGDDA